MSLRFNLPVALVLASLGATPLAAQSSYGRMTGRITDLIQEFRVQTAAYDASLGRFTGANINMVLKSGANQRHGSAWFSHLSRPLMTHPFFVNRNLYDTTSGPVTNDKRNRLWPATKTNRYRVQIGGPVVIPKLYDGRNKTFFSYGNDFMLRTFANISTQTVPTAPQRLGNFSDLLRLAGTYQIYDPNTIAPAPNGRFSRQPFPGNIIPASEPAQLLSTPQRHGNPRRPQQLLHHRPEPHRAIEIV